MANVHEAAQWQCHYTIAKFEGEWEPDKTPYEVVEFDGNLLMDGGVSCIWQALIGNGTTTAGQNLTYFNAAQAAIGVGDSATASVATQTDLQAATNKLRKGQNATFPAHTDGVTSAAQSIQWQSTFSTAEANFAWAEAGVFNSATAATGRMLNRTVSAMGTKTSASSWQITFTITIT